MQERKAKKSQLTLVRAKLEAEGKISRNWCLRNYISRLSAIIFDLRYVHGMRIDGSFLKTKNGQDYVYTLRK